MADGGHAVYEDGAGGCCAECEGDESAVYEGGAAVPRPPVFHKKASKKKIYRCVMRLLQGCLQHVAAAGAALRSLAPRTSSQHVSTCVMCMTHIEAMTRACSAYMSPRRASTRLIPNLKYRDTELYKNAPKYSRDIPQTR